MHSCQIMIIGYPSHAMTSRLHEEMRDRGHRSLLVHPDRVVTHVADGAVTVLPEVGSLDAVVLTTSTDQVTALHSAAQLQHVGIPVLNSPTATLRAADKIMTTVELARAGIPVPRTVSVGSLDTAMAGADLIGYPLVLKAADGAEGNQTRQVPSAEHLPEVFRELRASMGQRSSSRTPLLLQEQLQRALGRDRRLFVVGGRVQAAMDRVARPGEWRSNLSQGATPLPAEATTEEIDIAERTAVALGLDFTTVDLMAGDRGPVVIEANAFGDVLDVAMTSGLDLIGSLADLVEVRAGARPVGRISPKHLHRGAHAALSAMCRRRLADKRAELQQSTPAEETAPTRVVTAAAAPDALRRRSTPT
ncbi:MAG TPA: RimK family alpha-L-glutamate ligase [Microlunatus sp.]|nr:RimK family alpha-L-glutamate ligase [Microlunatus sp.]